MAYSDSQALFFMRIREEPEYPRCARSLAQAFTTINHWTRARRWLGIDLAHAHVTDIDAPRAYQQLLAGGH